jgi:hypothetical protein
MVAAGQPVFQGGGDDQVDPKSKFARHMDTGNVMNVDQAFS